MTRAELAIGDEAWCFVSEARRGDRRPAGAKRRTLLGTARVRIVGLAGELLRCLVLRASGGGILVGRELELPRGELFATTGIEHREFAAQVERFWGRK